MVATQERLREPSSASGQATSSKEGQREKAEPGAGDDEKGAPSDLKRKLEQLESIVVGAQSQVADLQKEVAALTALHGGAPQRDQAIDLLHERVASLQKAADEARVQEETTKCAHKMHAALLDSRYDEAF